MQRKSSEEGRPASKVSSGRLALALRAARKTTVEAENMGDGDVYSPNYEPVLSDFRSDGRKR